MKKGISLVVLVITIVVLIILTTTVMLSFKEGGVFNTAKEAVLKNDFSNVLDSFTLNKTNNMLSSLGDINSINATTEGDLESNIPIFKEISNKEINGHEYYKLIQIKDSVIYQSNFIENEKDEEISKWLEEIGIPKAPKIVDENLNKYWKITTDMFGRGTCIVNKYTGTQLNNVVIPDIIEGYTVTELMGLDINTSIAKFTGKLVIPSSVTKISSYAFSNCTGLTDVEIPSSVTKISSYAFFNCTGLTDVEIPSSVTKIDMYAFSQCNNLTKITIPGSVSKIGNYAFFGCNQLSEVIIEDGVETIGSYTFSQCRNLESVTIPSTVTSIGERAFELTLIENIIIPSKVEYMGYMVFLSCKENLKINVDKYETDCTSWDGSWNNRSSSIKYNVTYKTN